MEKTKRVAKEVINERLHQHTIWTQEQDDERDPDDWCSLLEDYASMYRRKMWRGEPEVARRRLIQVAAITIAAIEAIDRMEE